ncbi:MAG TPA: NAD(P)/FAD-dependent oxidoreductase [Solirubrobacteraceae bacterium]|nr:NAD(P)/FAD-dependent oxidoreductase [Solirubrobacteraceae bacterium]
MTDDADVVVIGGGVVGAAIASRLSLTKNRVCLLEATGDLAEGASKGNGGVANSGFDTEPGTLESELITASSRRWETLTAQLDVPFRRIGLLSVASTDRDCARLEELAEKATTNGVQTELVSGQRARELEPLVGPGCRRALWSPEDGIFDPMRLTIGYAELAAHNGADIRTRSPAIGFERDADRITEVLTPTAVIRTRFVVNATGLFADDIDALVGGDRCRMWPRRGQWWVLDREFGSRLRRVVAPVPGPEVRGVYVIPTTNGSALVGPTAEDREDRWDTSTDSKACEFVFEKAQELVPSVSPDNVIKSFAALRPASDDLYRVRIDGEIVNLLHATGIRSTGVSASPALADLVLQLLSEAGLDPSQRAGAVTHVPATPRFALAADPTALNELDPRYGQIICACEHVSAAEIAASLQMRVPARSLAGVRKRTRAMGGRCQGSVCTAGVAFICSLHMDLSPEDVPVDDGTGLLGLGRI